MDLIAVCIVCITVFAVASLVYNILYMYKNNKLILTMVDKIKSVSESAFVQMAARNAQEAADAQISITQQDINREYYEKMKEEFENYIPEKIPKGFRTIDDQEYEIVSGVMPKAMANTSKHRKVY